MLDRAAPKGSFRKPNPLIERSRNSKAIVVVSVAVLDHGGKGLPDHPPRRRAVLILAAQCTREAFGLAKGEIKPHEQAASFGLTGGDLLGQVGLRRHSGRKVDAFARPRPGPATDPD